MNRAYETVFGKSCASLYENPISFLDCIVPEDRHLIQQVHHSDQAGKVIEITYRINKPNNQIAWIRSKTSPLFNNKKELIGYAGVAVDISDLKNSEIKLRKANAFFEQAGEMSKVGSFEFDILRNTLYWSSVTKEIHEVSTDYVPNVTEAIGFYTDENNRKILSKAIEKSMKDQSSYDLELCITTAKGNLKWIRTIGRTEFENGICTRLFGTFQDIHSFKILEQRLEKERDGLNNVLEGTMAGTWEWDIQSGETKFNERWAEIIGYSLEELSPTTIETWTKFLHPEDSAVTEERLNQYFGKETEYYEAEFRMKHKNGEWIWILDRGKVCEFDQKGNPLKMAGTHQDINKRKKYEEKVRKLSIAIDQSPASIVITNLQGEIEYVNPYFTKITGYTYEEAIGKNPRILKSGDKSETDYANLWDKICKGEQWSGEFKNIKKSGEEYWEFASISPISDENGKITHFIAVKEEITHRKKNEALLNASERKYRSLFELSPFGMAAINKHTGEITSINKSFEELTGYKLEEYKTIERYMELAFPDEEYRNELIALRKDIFQNYLENGIQPDPVEIKIRTKSGLPRVIELTYIISGEFIVSIYHDKTEERDYIEALEKQNKILNEISWIQSHVVRAPLARMMGLFDLLYNKNFHVVSEEELFTLINSSMDELDNHIKQIAQKAYLVKYLSENKKLN